MRAHRRILILVTSSFLVSCQSEILHDLDEDAANRAVAALVEQGVPAEASSTARGGERHWTVTVPIAEAARARLVLHDAGLPGSRHDGLAHALDGKRLLPSMAEEEALLIRSAQSELAQTLESIGGVASARIHISTRKSRGLLGHAPETAPPATASVLLQYRGAQPPVDETQIKALVAGAVAGLAPENVNVLLIERASSRGAGLPRIVTLGPISVTQASIPTLKLWLGLSTGLTALLALLLVVSVLQLRTLRKKLSALERQSV